ncbi:hypothetical protein CYLTODRAFT_414066 [Cylindrobasidium torrendii FP15055 ss-10]|uniref:Uncharacterized protein n=1 Tax=Cylindrobasidium torrendii FP15055 ss-10 TaxID=1314674 RepID=A0A0D7AYT9_9AGAR|nr:hypothetical protein CYLTODRAFT_414066 [Cylindrobasidium torrendii FP15055 ss-10]
MRGDQTKGPLARSLNLSDEPSFRRELFHHYALPSTTTITRTTANMAAPSDHLADASVVSAQRKNSLRSMAPVPYHSALTSPDFKRRLATFSASGDKSDWTLAPMLRLEDLDSDVLNDELEVVGDSEFDFDAFSASLPSQEDLDNMIMDQLVSSKDTLELLHRIEREELAGEGGAGTGDPIPSLPVDTGKEVDLSPQARGGVDGAAESDDEVEREGNDKKNGDRSYTKPVARTSLLKRALSSADLATKAKRFRTTSEGEDRSKVEEDDATKVGQDSVRGSVEPRDTKEVTKTDGPASVEEAIPTPEPIVWEFMRGRPSYLEFAVLGHKTYISEHMIDHFLDRLRSALWELTSIDTIGDIPCVSKDMSFSGDISTFRDEVEKSLKVGKKIDNFKLVKSLPYLVIRSLQNGHLDIIFHKRKAYGSKDWKCVHCTQVFGKHDRTGIKHFMACEELRKYEKLSFVNQAVILLHIANINGRHANFGLLQALSALNIG